MSQPPQLFARVETRTNQVTLWVPGAVRAVSPAVQTLMQALDELGWTTGIADDLELALLEAVGNAVRHGCGDNPTHLVQVRARFECPDTVVVVVCDPGTGFDLDASCMTLPSDPLSAVHGRGLYLISHIMDDVSFARGGSEIRMRKRCSPSKQRATA